MIDYLLQFLCYIQYNLCMLIPRLLSVALLLRLSTKYELFSGGTANTGSQ